MKPTGEYLPPRGSNGWRWYFKFTERPRPAFYNLTLMPLLCQLGHKSHLLPVLLTPNVQVDSKLQTRTGGGNSTRQIARLAADVPVGLYFEIILTH